MIREAGSGRVEGLGEIRHRPGIANGRSGL